MSGVVRHPRLLVLADGAVLPGVIEANVVSNNHFAADRFRVTVAAGGDQLGLLARDGMVIEIQVSLDDGVSYARLLTGEADRVAFDPLRGIISIDGRDLAARLIETRAGESFANLTASEIATLLAARHQLAADVQTTTQLVGRSWEQGRDRLMLNRFGSVTTEWDLLVLLAGREGFDLWVSGRTLHFRPGRAGAITLSPADVVGLRLERALTLAGDVEVLVKSWSALRHRGFSQSARRAGAAGRRAQRYICSVPGLTEDEALQMAERRLAEITRHQRVVTLDMPGELAMVPRMKMSLMATGTDFDRDYWIDRVDRRISMAHGFRQSVHACNSNDVGKEGGSWSDS